LSKVETPLGHHLLNGILEWFYENEYSPIHILADVTHNSSPVVRNLMREDGTITFNIAPSAVKELLIDDKGVSFKARFGGTVQHVFVPLKMVKGVEIPLGAGKAIVIDLIDLSRCRELMGIASPSEITDPEKTPAKTSLRVVK
jgi:stringent starvation protein B